VSPDQPTPRRPPLQRFGESVARHAWWSLGGWFVILAVIVGIALIGVGGQTLFDRLSSTGFEVDAESSQGQAVLDAGHHQVQVVLAVHGVALDAPGLRDDFAAAEQAATDLGTDVTVANPVGTVWDQVDQARREAVRQAVAAAQAQADAQVAGGIAAGALPPGTAAPTLTPDDLPPGAVPDIGFRDVLDQIDDPGFATLLAADGQGALLIVTVDGAEDSPSPDRIDQVVAALQPTVGALRADLTGASVELGGPSLIADSMIEQSKSDLARGEMVALPIALLVMLVVFAGFIAAGLPLVGAGAAIGGSIGLLYALTYALDVNTTVLSVVSAIGLGLSIDYGLLMTSRFREEFHRLADAGPGQADLTAQIRQAVGRTVDTAGRTAMFSGTVFAIAAAGLLLFEPVAVKALGLGALLAAAIGVLAAGTLTPALLALLGRHLIRPGRLTRIPRLGRLLRRFGDISPVEGVFSRLARLVQRAPALVTILCLAALGALGSLFTTLQIATTSADAIPASSTQYAFVQTMRANFPEAWSPRVALVASSPADLDAWIGSVEDLDTVQSIGQPRPMGDGWLATVGVEANNAVDLVPALRDGRPAAVTGWVVGEAAATFDLGQSLLATAPWAIVMIALAAMLFLFMATGSFILPIKAVLLSVLSLSAAVGVLVWGFQDTHLAGIMGFDASQVHGVEVVVLLLSLVFGFGLAMDYELFILSRITEQLHAGVRLKEAIPAGLQRSGRIITSAALIIAIVFIGFATGDFMVIKALGIALASAVLLDATIVRMLLVPAIMTWGEPIMFWAPKWAKRLHARVGLAD
jgi:RND superfamily putative drug exporter